MTHTHYVIVNKRKRSTNTHSDRQVVKTIRSNLTEPSGNVYSFFNRACILFSQVAEIHAESSRLEVTNTHLTSDLALCENTGKEAAADAAKQLRQKQTAHDNQVGTRTAEEDPLRPPSFQSNVHVFVQVERLLLEQNRLRDDKKLLEERLALKEKALLLQQQIAATQNKVGDPDAGRVEESTSVALNQIYTDGRQKYEISSDRKDGQEREAAPQQYN